MSDLAVEGAEVVTRERVGDYLLVLAQKRPALLGTGFFLGSTLGDGLRR